MLAMSLWICQQVALSWGRFENGKRNREMCGYCLRYFLKDAPYRASSYELIAGHTFDVEVMSVI